MSGGDKDRTAEVLEILQGKGDLYAKTSLFEEKRAKDLKDAIKHIVSDICNIKKYHLLEPYLIFPSLRGRMNKLKVIV